MPGRHAQQPGRHSRGRIAIVAAGIGVVVVLGGILAWSMATKPTPATTVAGTTGPSTSAVATADPNTPPTALVACAGSIESGTAVVERAVPAHDHWAGHVQAQLDYDSKKISRQQMLDTFAATKVFGAADLADFDAARTAFQPVAAACDGLDTTAMPPRWAQVAVQCGQRAGELAKAVQAGDAVVADWRAHVAMMQNKPHTDPNVYGTMWRSMVDAAPKNLNGFTAARDALNQQPPCSVSTS
jgi:hypothetical protein